MHKHKDDTEEVRWVFVKDPGLSKTGFTTHAAATAAVGTLVDNEQQRVRVRYRSRTETFDLVVKVRRDARTVTPSSMRR